MNLEQDNSGTIGTNQAFLLNVKDLNKVKGALNSLGVRILSIENNELLFKELLSIHPPRFCILSFNELDGALDEKINEISKISPHSKIILFLPFIYFVNHKPDNLNLTGIISEDANQEELILCFKKIISGSRFIPDVSVKNKSVFASDSLTSQEAKIFGLITDGFINNNVLAERLFVSPNTIKNHKLNIIKKMNLKGAHELYAVAREGIKI